MTSTQLTGLCKEDKAAISRCIKQLTELGYVTTDKSAEKRSYRNLLFLTEEGKALSQKMEARVQHVLSVIGEGIDIIKKILIGICVAATVLIAGIGFLWGNEIKTLSSFKTIINQNLSHKDGYTYEMTFSGDYYFDDFLEQGGVSDDKELISFITEKIAKGIIPISIEAPEIACSSFTATTEDGDFFIWQKLRL